MLKDKQEKKPLSQEEMMRLYLEFAQKQFDDSGYPAVCQGFTRQETMLPMGDGVKLYTLIFKPELPGPYPTIIQRSCYPNQAGLWEINGKNFAQRGFAYVVVVCRGTGKSEGTWVPNENERRDGIDTLAWLNAQPWVDTIGYYGASYLALTGWAIADVVPEKVKGMMLTVYGCDRFKSAYEKGLFRHDVLTGWAMQNAGFPVTADYLESCRFRPQNRVDAELWGQTIPWYQDWIHATSRSHPYWHQGWWKMLGEIPGKMQVPVYIVDAWYDHHFGSAMNTYDSLSEGVKAHSWLDIGCWNHMSQNCMAWGDPQNLQLGDTARALEWFTLVLKQKQTPQRRVRGYVMGEDRWQEYPQWPAPVAETKTFYLDGQGGLSASPAPAGERSYDYDPQNPVATHGAESVLTTITEAGTLLQPEPDFRPDVLSFVSAPLTEDISLCGKLRVQLKVTTDGEDTAFTAKVMEVFPDGKAYNIRSSITTIAADLPQGQTYTPGTPVQTEVEMWDMIWTLHKGSRLRVDISSSDFPQYAVHSNYAGCWADQAETRVAHQTLLMGGEDGCRILLPIG